MNSTVLMLLWLLLLLLLSLLIRDITAPKGCNVFFRWTLRGSFWIGAVLTLKLLRLLSHKEGLWLMPALYVVQVQRQPVLCR